LLRRDVHRSETEISEPSREKESGGGFYIQDRGGKNFIAEKKKEGRLKAEAGGAIISKGSAEGGGIDKRSVGPEGGLHKNKRLIPEVGRLT